MMVKAEIKEKASQQALLLSLLVLAGVSAGTNLWPAIFKSSLCAQGRL